MSRAKQSLVGMCLASIIIAAWLSLHVYGVFLFQPHFSAVWKIVPLVLCETWLSAGLFIVAHDAIHGSLAPTLPALNKCAGRLCLGLYAFFPYEAIAAKHHAHHKYSGYIDDPDFNVYDSSAFWPWFIRFFMEYFGWAQLGLISAVVLIYTVGLHAHILNILIFWALPALGSSVQLFTFGTWLPHRHEDVGFCDRHNARTLDYNWLGSLAACYHFGYHLDHHRSPQSPWWSLPNARAKRLAQPATA